MTPPKSILDPKFRYRPAAQTNLRLTFARIRREQAKQIAALESPRTILGRLA